MKSNNQEMVSIYKSITDVTSQITISLEDFINHVRNGQYKNLIDPIRQATQTGDKETASRLKKTILPMIVPSGIIKGRRMDKNLELHNGLICIDIDDLPGNIDEWRDKAASLDYTAATFVSPSGNGLKVFVRTDATLDSHRMAFILISNMIKRDIPGVRIDPSCSNPSRGCLVSFDEHAVFRCQSRVIEVPLSNESDIGSPASQMQKNDLSISRYVNKFRADHPFEPGCRHQFIVQIASAINAAGFSEFEAIQECCSRFTQPGFTEKEIRETIHDIFKRYATEHGKNQPPLNRLTWLTTRPTFAATPNDDNNDLTYTDLSANKNFTPTFGFTDYKQLPELLQELLCYTDDEYDGDITLLSGIVVIGSLLHNVCGYMNKHIYYPNLYTSISGTSGSGKGYISGIYELAYTRFNEIAEESAKSVLKFENQLAGYNAYHKQPQSRRTGTPPVKPQVVRQQELLLGGNTSQPLMVEMLSTNAPYGTLLFETEAEVLANNMQQDYGKYDAVLNQAYQHESVKTASRSGGRFHADKPKLSIVVTGTPRQQQRMLRSTENGLFSRFLYYILPPNRPFKPLSDLDDKPEVCTHFTTMGEKFRELALHQQQYPLNVSLTVKQRKQIEHIAEEAYTNCYTFGNEDLCSLGLRSQLNIYRICMILTALRRFEQGLPCRHMVVEERDLDTAIRIENTCIKHGYLVATSLKREKEVNLYQDYNYLYNFFIKLPEEFERKSAEEIAIELKISHSTLSRFLRKSVEKGFLLKSQHGHYKKIKDMTE